MPIVIKELVIVANITEDKGKSTNLPLQNGNAAKASITEDVKMQIITEAVQQVMDILERQKER